MVIKYCEPNYPILINPNAEAGEISSNPSELKVKLKPMTEDLNRPKHQLSLSKKSPISSSPTPAIGSSLIRDIRETQKMIERLEAIILMNEASL